MSNSNTLGPARQIVLDPARVSTAIDIGTCLIGQEGMSTILPSSGDEVEMLDASEDAIT